MSKTKNPRPGCAHTFERWMGIAEWRIQMGLRTPTDYDERKAQLAAYNATGKSKYVPCGNRAMAGSDLCVSHERQRQRKLNPPPPKPKPPHKGLERMKHAIRLETGLSWELSEQIAKVALEAYMTKPKETVE